MSQQPTDPELIQWAAVFLERDVDKGERPLFRTSTHTAIIRRLVDSYGEYAVFDPTKCRNDDALVQAEMEKRRDAEEVALWHAFQEALFDLQMPRRKHSRGLMFDVMGHYQTGDFTRASHAAREAMQTPPATTE